MHYPELFKTYCNKLNLKLTSVRKEVLYIFWESKKTIKAYEVLNALTKIKPNATAPSVYRTLDFFVANGTLHKIESIQSYTLCNQPLKQLNSELLIVCNSCHSVTEVYDSKIHELFTQISNKNNFQLHSNPIEIKGTCQNCQLLLEPKANNLTQ